MERSAPLSLFTVSPTPQTPQSPRRGFVQSTAWVALALGGGLGMGALMSRSIAVAPANARELASMNAIEFDPAPHALPPATASRAEPRAQPRAIPEVPRLAPDATVPAELLVFEFDPTGRTASQPEAIEVAEAIADSPPAPSVSVTPAPEPRRTPEANAPEMTRVQLALRGDRPPAPWTYLPEREVTSAPTVATDENESWRPMNRTRRFFRGVRENVREDLQTARQDVRDIVEHVTTTRIE